MFVHITLKIATRTTSTAADGPRSMRKFVYTDRSEFGRFYWVFSLIVLNVFIFLCAAAKSTYSPNHSAPAVKSFFSDSSW